MQNRYVGDVGDFGKYALLRRLCGLPGEQRAQLGIVWCLFPDENHNKDGRHISYLSRPEFLDLDVELLQALKKIIASGRRCVSAVKKASIFPPGTVFYEAPVVPSEPKKASRELRLRF